MSTNLPIPLPSAEYLANSRWIQDHLDELVRQYPDQWIAVAGGQVLAAGPDLGQVRRQARQKCSSPEVACEFLAGVTMIF